MTLNDFVIKYNGRYIDFDGSFGNQCTDLYRQYCKECLQVPQSPPVIGAADIWINYLEDKFDAIPNTTEAIPQEGDIIIWGRKDSLPYGHVAICIGTDNNVNYFYSFDQNWPTGSPCHVQKHLYPNVLGWLRLKGGETDVITDSTKIPQIGNKEVQQIKAEMEAKDRAINDYQLTIASANSSMASMQKEINVLTAKLAQAQADIQQLQANSQTSIETAKAKVLDSLTFSDLLVLLLSKLKGVKK